MHEDRIGPAKVVPAGKATPVPPLGMIPAGSYRFVALDVETANVDIGSICQIGLACVDTDNRVTTYSTYIKPVAAFSSANIAVHGINPATVRDSPSFSQAFAALIPLLSRHTIVQHSNFDKQALDAACGANRIVAPAFNWIDSLQIARRAWPELREQGGHGLRNLTDVLRIDFRHHDAAEDARAAAEIVLAAERHTGLGLAELAAARSPRRRTTPRVAVEGVAGGLLSGHIAVFTGSLSIDRHEAANLAAAAGITVTSNVTRQTTLLVIGDQDSSLLAGHSKSTKHRKAEEYVARGQVIRFMGEAEFLSLVGAGGAGRGRREPAASSPDWLALITMSGNSARRMADEMPGILGDPDLTAERANELFALVNKQCMSIEQLLDMMADADVGEDLYDAASAANELWGTLAAAMAERVMAFREG